MKKLIPLLTLLLFFLSCSKPSIEVVNLRCEYLDEPQSIENRTPLLSWQIISMERGKSQTAYHILVADDPGLLNKDVGNYWDTGKIVSHQSVIVPYQGKQLHSWEKLYWKVKVWDENNEVSNWSHVASFSMGLLNSSDWSAHWIGRMTDPYPDSILTWPAPYFRKEFTVAPKVKDAKVYVCGLGFYELYINGKKVGDQVLAPAVTNYDKRTIQNILYHYDDQSTQRVLYNTFDVTELINSGENAIGVILGNGWYNQRDRTVEGCMWYDVPKLLLQLEILYEDGTSERIITDESWKSTTAAILHDGIFTGEIYDARLEIDLWDTAGFDDKDWSYAVNINPPSGTLHSQTAPYDKIIRTIQPEFKGKINDSTFLYSLPEMISGWAELNVKGSSGDKIKLRFIGEENEDFGQYDTYILKGGEAERWEPRFTWHTFRFIEAITHDIELNGENILVKVVHTDVPERGKFSCSNELFNTINSAYIRTQNMNFHGSISSDCPHRERLAYTGDGQVVVESSIFSYDMAQFYRKWFDDMEDARNKNTGYVPHTAPFGGGGGGPAWGSAYVIMPWAYYCYYGDTTILTTHYQGMKDWVNYLSTRTDDQGIVIREEPDGWCLGDWCTPGRVTIPESLVNTAYYYHSAHLLSKISSLVGEKSDCVYFTKLAAQIKDDFNARFFNPETNFYHDGKQGANVFPLAFGMVPADKEQAVFDALLTHLKSLDYHFDTGILGTPLLINVLTDYGRADLAYKVMDQRSYPGYHYLLEDEYSCIWERWDGKASRCHPMFGSVVAWFYHTLAGIRYNANNPGMKHFYIEPSFIPGLDFCTADYTSLYGTIRSAWKCVAGKYELEVTVPVNATATIVLPTAKADNLMESGKKITKVNGIRNILYEEDTIHIEISSGTYSFTF